MHPLQPQYRSNRPDSQIHPVCIPLLLIAFICLFAYIDAPSQPKSQPEHMWRDFRFHGFPEGEPGTIDEMRELMKSPLTPEVVKKLLYQGHESRAQ